MENNEELLQLKKKIKKWTEDLSRYFSKQDIQISNKRVKRYSTLPIIREVHIKTIMKYHLTLVKKWLISKILKVLESMWRKGNPYTLLVGL